MSVRLPLPIVSKLQSEAVSRGIGLSDLTKEVLAKHAIWSPYRTRVPLVSVPPALVARMLSHFSDPEIEQLARYSGKVVLSQLGDAIAKEDGIETSLGLLKAWLENSRMTVTYSSGDRISCLVLHDLGRKWSFYLGNLAESVLIGTKVSQRLQFKAMEKSLAFTIGLRHQY